jgi:hypothetical protein
VILSYEFPNDLYVPFTDLVATEVLNIFYLYLRVLILHSGCQRSEIKRNIDDYQIAYLELSEYSHASSSQGYAVRFREILLNVPSREFPVVKQCPLWAATLLPV